MPRVITGSARGTQLRTPRGMNTRPTADRVKESVFNIIADRIYDINMLDLFAGTGQMGIEALSRGAAKVVFIDSNPDSIDCIKANLEKTRLASKASVINANVSGALSTISSDTKYDLVYIDPPYADAVRIFREISRILIARNLLSESALVLIEHSAEDASENFVTNLKFKRRCKYGTVMLSFYGRHDTND
ncbi:MAG: 16S rRNA (guanine(966)-N(2))-methyltransferase RsmD [Saccharofermentanales bacterium]